MRFTPYHLLIVAGFFAACPCPAEETAESARLSLTLNNGQSVRYDWNIQTSSESKGRENNKAFTLNNEKKLDMMVTLRGLPRSKDDTIPVAMKISDWSLNEKNSIGASAADGKPEAPSTTEVAVDKKHVKAVENGTVKIDSDNDIGLQQVEDLREYVRRIENNEIRITLDRAGRQSEVSGESPVIEEMKNTAQGIFPILAARDVKPGESWEDTLKMPKLGAFRLAKPASVKSRMTFVKWIEKNGCKLASIDMVSAWDKGELRGESANGLLVEISRLEGLSAGTCLFDPRSGQFVEGTVNITIGYHIDGEKDGQATGLDVSGKTLFTFTRKGD